MEFNISYTKLAVNEAISSLSNANVVEDRLSTGLGNLFISGKEFCPRFEISRGLLTVRLNLDLELYCRVLTRNLIFQLSKFLNEDYIF